MAVTPARRRWVLFAAVTGTVVVASLIPVPSGGAERFLLGVGLDKWIHGLGYAAVSLTFARAWAEADGGAAWRVVLAAVVVGTAIGGCVELLQTAVATRSASVADAAANTVGGVGGSMLWVSRR